MRAKDQPAFVFINLLEPHAPWNITPAAWAQPHVPRLRDEPGWMGPYVTDSPLGLDFYKAPAGQQHSGFVSSCGSSMRSDDAADEYMFQVMTP